MNRNGSEILSNCPVGTLRKLMQLATAPDHCVGSLPSLAGSPEQWKEHLNRLCEGEEYSGDVLLDIVSTPDNSIETIVFIKDQSKTLHKKATTDKERTACLLLYNAAIAAALSFHGKWISRRSIGDVQPLFDDLAIVLRSDPLGNVFRTAADHVVQ